MQVYENASHNLLQELDDVRHAVLKEISSWIVQRLTTPPEPADTTSATIAIATTAPATTSANATTDIPASEGPTDAESPNSAPVLEIEPSETATESSSILTEPNVDDSSKTETPPVDQESTEASVEKPVVQETTDDVVVESRTETEQDTSEQVEVTTCNE